MITQIIRAVLKETSNMPELTSEEIEQKIKSYEERAGFPLSAHNKATMRDILRMEHRFEEREAVREDSHGPIADLFNAGNRE